MSFRVEFTRQAEADILRLDKSVAQLIVNKIDRLSQSIEKIVPTQLKGKFKGKYKLRAGDWRIIYSINNSVQVITVYAIRHRREVYKI
jgi:mRNA interferase RelE/StbE